MTATATRVNGAAFGGYGPTSEFSEATQVESAGPPPGISISASNTTPLTVAPGGSVSFSYTIVNNTAASVSGQLWYNARNSSGSTVAQAVILAGSLTAGGSTSGSYTQQIPASAPSGTYTYCLRTGTFPGSVADEACFALTVGGSGMAARSEEDPEVWTLSAVTPWVPVATQGLQGENARAAGRADVPESLALEAVYPNPARSSATVTFALPEAAAVRLAVYDVLGREVAVLAEGAHETGRHAAALDTWMLPAGVYLVRLEVADPGTGADGAVQTRRLTVVR